VSADARAERLRGLSLDAAWRISDSFETADALLAGRAVPCERIASAWQAALGLEAGSDFVLDLDAIEQIDLRALQVHASGNGAQPDPDTWGEPGPDDHEGEPGPGAWQAEDHDDDEPGPLAGEGDRGEACGPWAPRNLGLLGERPDIRPALGDIGLLYPGKRHAFTGPQESAKTIAAYAAILGVVRAGATAILVDFEMGEYDARDRLREMGATAADFERILYLNPETRPTAEIIDALVSLRPDLFVIDSALGAFNLSELDDNKRRDVELFLAGWVRPFWLRGIATIVLDHVVKNADNRGKYAIGSERKVGGIDVHLGFEAVIELTRGGRGLYKITTHKDRPGWLPRPRAAELEIVSAPDTHTLSWTFNSGHGRDQQEDAWRPTELMERLSRKLETQEAPISKTALANSVQGKREWRFRAIDFLILDDYAEIVQGGNIASVKPYRQTDTGSQPSQSSLVPKVPSVPSGSRTGSQPGGNHTGSQVPRSSIEREPGTMVASEEPDRLYDRHRDIAEGAP
jgi:hypothetical protein